MGCMVVGSKIYMVGGENTKEGSMLLDRDEINWLNSDNVYAFDPTKSEDRLVLVRDGAVPSLNAPKTCPLVVTLEGKFYLLSRKPCLGCLTGNFDHQNRNIAHRPIFEGFDPTLPIPSWKILPDYPPYTKTYPTSGPYPTSASDYFAWGHKLVSAPPDYFIFDAKDVEWKNGHWLLRQFADKSAPYPHGVAVEFKGILFAVSNDIKAVVAYDLDAGGHLNAHWVLDELSEVFQGPPLLYPSQSFLTDLGGGRMCLLFNGLEGDRWTIRVEVFQVSITTVGDRPVVRRGSLHSFYLGSWIDYNPEIFSVFVCDHSNKSDIEADASSGLYSCEDLKKRAEHAVEYVKGDSKKQKTT
ncbi:hypothetical protein CKAN_02246700 [Cinnamomum micranthum f. kanehirae]|uniref:Uncharacterized protein n=1 Tax=Cinnamomum micranthum f. kanehirae TaxID=337451 RepID=A0A443PR32_9MAGN|nr:hypothetical protein CKAN_02246700 [Cinnamomum micranthum f. kanehirae]